MPFPLKTLAFHPSSSLDTEFFAPIDAPRFRPTRDCARLRRRARPGQGFFLYEYSP